MQNQQWLRYQFEGINQVPYSYSQIGQDIFVLSCLKGKKNGRYVEIGAYHPTEISNTYILEKYYNWTGISLDINESSVELFNQHRYNFAIQQDAMIADYNLIFNTLGWTDSKIIDYASIDCEPPENTFRALQQLIQSEYTFAVITFEHDTYQATQPIKQMSRDLLFSKGYELVVGGLMGSPDWHDQEDWYVHPDHVDMQHIALMKSNIPNQYWQDYIYPNKL
jgi:hypothetical protein